MSRNRAIQLTFATLAIAFFATPIAARILGITAESFENRKLADPPKLSQGWNAFDQTTRFLTDRMPLRKQAVEANTRIWTDVLGATPRYAGDQAGAGEALPFAGAAAGQDAAAEPAAAPAASASQVIRGDDGWLYLQAEHDRACAPAVALATALARWARLVATVRAQGKRAVVLVAPDKASVHPEQLPDEFPNADCAARGKRELWRTLERAAPRSGVLPLRQALLRERERSEGPLYMRKDSHWNSAGSLVLVRAALAAAGGGVRVLPAEVADGGDEPYGGDLTTLLGESEQDTRPVRTVARRPGAPTVPGRALLVKDSYGEMPTAQLVPYFADLRSALWVGTPPEQLAREIAGAQTVVFETVERELAARAVPGGPVELLTDALRQHPGRP